MKSPAKMKKKHSKNLKRKVSNTLKANKNFYEGDTSYVPFIKSFVSSLLKEADEAEAKEPENFTPDQNKQDFENSLEPETEPNQFDIEGTDPNVLANAITSVKEWSGKLDEFAHFLNDPNTQSLHKLLASEDRPGSLVRGITRKASDSITRIAGEIAKLKETLNGFINMAPKKQRDSEALLASSSAGGA